jgi:O-antigen/teichoic acid export membrane protein
LMLPLYSLPGVAIYVLLPQFSQIQLQSATEFRRILSRALNYVFLFTLPAALGVAVLASNIIDVFNYPATFQHSIPVLQLLAVSLPFTAVTMITATGISAMRRERSWAYVSLGSLIALICLGLILIPLSRDLWQNAAVGAAMAVLGSELVTIGMAWVLFGRLMIDRSFFTLLGKTLLATTVMTAVVMLSRHLPIAIPIMLGATTYGATVLLFKAIPEDDVQAAQAMIERRLRPALRALLAALMRNR